MRASRTSIAWLRLVILGLSFYGLAQPKEKVWRIGYLAPRPRPNSGGFFQGLRELGYEEGKNVVIERRQADGQYERLPGLATELVRLRVDVIITDNLPATLAAQSATKTIPILFTAVADAVGFGVVKSFSRPEGNTTGISNLMRSSVIKQMEILLTLLPSHSQVAVLYTPDSQHSLPMLKDIQSAFPVGMVRIVPIEVRNEQTIQDAFLVMSKEQVRGLTAIGDPLFVQQRQQLAALSMKYKIPGVFGSNVHPEAGSLMSYGSDIAESFHRLATFVDKIFKGAKPGDLPVEQPTKIEMVINMKTAKALGITIPPQLLLLADKLIE